MIGSDVNQLMLLLVRHGYLDAANLNTQNLFTAEVDAAVRRFQTASGIPADGIVGSLAIVYLRRLEDMPAGALGARVLQTGMVGPDVNELILLLLRGGHLAPADLNTEGRFTPAVEVAVRRFQRQYALPEDGIVTPSVATALRQIDAGR